MRSGVGCTHGGTSPTRDKVRGLWNTAIIMQIRNPRNQVRNVTQSKYIFNTFYISPLVTLDETWRGITLLSVFYHTVEGQ